VTSQPQPAPGEGRSAVQILRPLRDLAAYALLAATAVWLFVAFLQLIPFGDGLTFTSRATDSFDGFVNLATVIFPLGAVLLALLIQPQHPNARLVTIVALAEYAVAAFFAVVFGLLVALVQIAGNNVMSAFEALLSRGAWLVVFAVAAVATFRIWRHFFHVAKPPQGLYGQPQYGVPGTYPGQPGYGQPPAHGQPPAYGQPQPYGQPPVYGGPPSAVPAAPTGYAQQGPPPGYGQPVYPGVPQGSPPPPGTWGQPPASAPPASAPPASASPASAPPGPYAPAPGHVPGPFTDPSGDSTVIVPPNPPADRPGFGPADQDQPRY
jgi:hypothetical protein